MMHRKIFLFVTAVELVVCICLGGLIFQRLKPKSSIIPINSDLLGAQTGSSLVHYHEFKPNIQFKERPYWSSVYGTYSINADTLNSVKDYQLEKPQDAFRIITLGDSFTMGVFVDTKESWPSQLEYLLNDHIAQCSVTKKAEVINLGMEGYDPEYEVERFRIRGKKYSPDLLIWFIRDNDFTDITEFITSKSDQLKERIDTIKEKSSMVYREELNQVWRDAHKALVDEMGYEAITQYQHQQLLKMRDLYQGAILVITDKDTPSKYMEILTSYAKADVGISLLLLNPYHTFEDGHPDSVGNKQIAQQVESYLQSIAFNPCHVR